MNWINNVVRPKIQDFLNRREMPDNLWIKCPESGQLVFKKNLEENQFVVPGSDYHMRVGGLERLKITFDDGDYELFEHIEVPHDPLKFRDEKKYADRLKENKSKTKREDAVAAAAGKLRGMDVVIAVQDFNFMGGSLGMAAGEAILNAMLKAVEKESPFIIFTSSGGARMQEGILSLMQMPRTTIGVQKLREANLPYIVVFTNPTTGGVTASYAMLGDVHIAEPGALICFAGPRVIKQTIREQLPPGFQRSEYLFDHGMIDMVTHRHELRSTLSRILHTMMGEPVPQLVDKPIKPTSSPTAEEMNGARPNSKVNGAVKTDETKKADTKETKVEDQVKKATKLPLKSAEPSGSDQAPDQTG